MTEPPPIVTLLTDFGENDSYVGAMKGVILSIAPDVSLVDISHQVDPQNIRQAASIIANVYPYYPPQTVHLIVVDPGVGSRRRAIAFETPRGRFVAPDNGVLTHVLRRETISTAVVLENPVYWRENPSPTFHGRDIFSPVAAHLARGVDLVKLGPICEDLVQVAFPELTVTPSSIEGEIARIDRFGNILTNITPLVWVDDETLRFEPPDAVGSGQPLEFAASRVRVTFSWHTVSGIRRTYSEVRIGETLALIGSSSELEISVNQGDAQRKLGVEVGLPVTLDIT